MLSLLKFASTRGLLSVGRKLIDTCATVRSRGTGAATLRRSRLPSGRTSQAPPPRSAERGGGAWLVRPDGSRERLKVAAPVPLDRTVAHVSISFLPTESKPRVLANFSKLSISANYRVAGHDYRTMASGHCHALQFNKLMPWDHAPGRARGPRASA